MVKRAREEFKTYQNVFDAFTEKNLYKLISQGYFEGLISQISIGKEANVFSARRDGDIVVVKIYRLETCDFNRMYDYIKADPRYAHLRKQHRKIVFAWAQREYRNLLLAREAGVKVPTVFAVLYNIVVMEQIGKNSPAPQLKDAVPDDPKMFFGMIMDNLKSLYKSGLVHADLSAFNILNELEMPVLIDFSQTTSIKNPQALEYLERDIYNLCTFFRKNGYDMDPKKVIKDIISV